LLVSSRKSTERMQIGTDIVVTVLELRGNNMRLGIEALGEIPVKRSELQDELDETPSGRKSVVAESRKLPALPPCQGTRQSL